MLRCEIVSGVEKVGELRFFRVAFARSGNDHDFAALVAFDNSLYLLKLLGFCNGTSAEFAHNTISHLSILL